MRDLYLLDLEWTHLNHGSFGACPRPVLEEYQRLQRDLEQQPTEFFRQVPDAIAAARAELAAYVGADPEGLLFMQNVTMGVNAVARSLRLGPGDEVLTTDHEYGSNNLLWQYLAERDGFEYVRRPYESLDDFWAGANERTRVLFVSHIASETARRFPVGALCARACDSGIVSIVDGAHAPGHVDLDLAELGADFYAGNCHNWCVRGRRMRRRVVPRRPAAGGYPRAQAASGPACGSRPRESGGSPQEPAPPHRAMYVGQRGETFLGRGAELRPGASKV